MNRISLLARADPPTFSHIPFLQDSNIPPSNLTKGHLLAKIKLPPSYAIAGVLSLSGKIRMRLIIRDDAEAASLYVADYIISRIKQCKPTKTRPFVLGLPTGTSPVGVYRILVQKHRSGEISFGNVITFNMDEYIGLPRDSQESYHTFMWNHLFSKIDIEPRNVNILDGNATDLEAECIAYEEKIKAVGGIDLFLSGIGEDGHIAFNEPGSSLVSRTRVKTLAYDTILANARFFDGDVDKVPKMALTVGVQTILEAHEVVVIVLGAKKALALQRTIEHGVNHMWTLSALQLHRHPMIVVDDDATLELQIKTVKYFKSIEKVSREQGFDQILPAKARGCLRLMDKPITNGNGIIHGRLATDPAPVTSGLAAPVSEYPLRSTSPDFTPDRMMDRIVILNGL